MSRSMQQNQQKIAERLFLLNDRGIGLLTRIYNIKKACQDPKSKPAFLSDKSLESCIKQIVKKFPLIDKNNQFPAIVSLKGDIIRALSLYYYTFVDLMDFRDHVQELLANMDECALKFDITTNFDLTKGYLDLVTNYATLMIMLSMVEDRKAVLGLYNYAYEMERNQADQSFPRLGQLIADFDLPQKKLYEEFGPHSKLVGGAVMSLLSVYPRRNLSVEEWRKARLLSLVYSPAHMLYPAQSDTLPCEYLSVDTMEKWIIFGFMMCPSQLVAKEAVDLWKQALSNCWCVTLFRDEVMVIHKILEGFLESLKGGFQKLSSDVKHCATAATQNAGRIHQERRKYLRTVLKELSTILTDEPGLLGPKALYVFMGLSFARDEVHWLVRHAETLHSSKNQKARSNPDFFEDRQLAELLFYMEELRALVKKYNQVLQRYFIQYLSGFDAIVLNNIVQNLSVCPEDESVIMSSFVNIMQSLTIQQVEENNLFDFRGLRMDWYRLQAYTSVSRAALVLSDNKDLAKTLNTVVFHTKMIDYLDEMLVETSDLSIFCHCNTAFEKYFRQCLAYPAQARYVIVYPIICSHFMDCTHELCPEERHHVGERSLSTVNLFLDEMAKEIKNIVTLIVSEQVNLSDKLLPKHSVPSLVAAEAKKKKEHKKKQIHIPMKPGEESFRKTIENFTDFDKHHMELTELCYSINYTSNILVWEHLFSPREYLLAHLESRFTKAIVGMMMYDPTSKEIAKPSELLSSVKTYMSVLQSIENCVHVDMTRVFNTVLLQQTQPTDSHGEKTVAQIYTNWYLEEFLRKVTTGNICYSPKQKAFVSLSTEGSLPFVAEEYADITELQSLSELLGPYGMKFMNESLMWHISSQVAELKKLVLANREILAQLRTNFDKPSEMVELFKRLKNVDNVLQRMSIIGVLLAFRALAQEALNDVLSQHIPFLLTAIEDFKNHFPSNQNTDFVNKMATSAGLRNDIDPLLVNALQQQQRDQDPDEEYRMSCLLMVFLALSIPQLATSDQSMYRPEMEGLANNSHCLSKAVNSIAGALFTIHGRGDVEERLKEFLALASSSLLRLGQETDKQKIRNRESVYLLLDMIVQESPFLTMDLLESCFPYVLLRNSYHAAYKKPVS